MELITSPLRYPGGKAKALSKILPLIPTDFSEYREPFVGGGSVFIALKQLRPDATYKINDLNHDLYCFWLVVKNNVDELVGEIMRLRNSSRDGKIFYGELSRMNDTTEFCRAMRFYIMNRITYSGTVDSGGFSLEAFKKRFTMSNINKLKPLSSLLQDVTITNDSYETLLLEKVEDAFIYLDPPYWKSKKSKLYGRNGDLHKEFDHRIFAENVRKCENKYLITCDDSEEIRKLFKFANILRWELQYGMNNVNSKHAKKGKELFITNYPAGKDYKQNQPVLTSFNS